MGGPPAEFITVGPSRRARRHGPVGRLAGGEASSGGAADISNTSAKCDTLLLHSHAWLTPAVARPSQLPQPAADLNKSPIIAPWLAQGRACSFYTASRRLERRPRRRAGFCRCRSDITLWNSPKSMNPSPLVSA